MFYWCHRAWKYCNDESWKILSGYWWIMMALNVKACSGEARVFQETCSMSRWRWSSIASAKHMTSTIIILQVCLHLHLKIRKKARTKSFNPSLYLYYFQFCLRQIGSFIKVFPAVYYFLVACWFVWKIFSRCIYVMWKSMMISLSHDGKNMIIRLLMTRCKSNPS